MAGIEVKRVRTFFGKGSSCLIRVHRARSRSGKMKERLLRRRDSESSTTCRCTCAERVKSTFVACSCAGRYNVYVNLSSYRYQ